MLAYQLSTQPLFSCVFKDARFVKSTSLSDYECHHSSDPLQSFKVSAPIRQIAWDPKGERLAVLFEKDTSQTHIYVALFSVQRKPFIDLTPIGLVKGPLCNLEKPSIYPVHISFAHHYNRGALLSVVSVH
jgi:hypothetical protein